MNNHVSQHKFPQSHLYNVLVTKKRDRCNLLSRQVSLGYVFHISSAILPLKYFLTFQITEKENGEGELKTGLSAASYSTTYEAL